MSYEDLKEARAKRAEKEAANKAKGKGKRGQKCKSATPEADEATADKANRTDVKGHTWSCKLSHSPKLCRVAESLLRQDARYGAVIPTAGKGVHLALKSDYSSSDL